MAQTLAISITSGKGGVGKTLATVSIASHLQKMGQKVLILDGDLGLANCDVIMGISARYCLQDVLNGHILLEDIIVSCPAGVDLIPSGSGIRELVNLSPSQYSFISAQISQIQSKYDVILIDTGAGIGDIVLRLNRSADKNLVITTPEPHALTDAYALIKVMSEETKKKSFDLVVNQVRSQHEGLKIFERIAEVASKFLNVKIFFAGSVPNDPQVARTVMSRSAAQSQSFHTISGQAWAHIARNLLDQKSSLTPNQSGFWGQLVHIAGL